MIWLAQKLPGTIPGIAVLVSLMLPAVCSYAKDLPAWVTSPPIDTVSSMYGVGEGKDRESAKSAALAAIAGTMMTKVQGSTFVNQRQDQGGYAEQVEQTVQTKVREVALSHYQVIEAEKSGGRWWVLVELDRIALFEDGIAELKQADRALTSAMGRYDALSLLERYLEEPQIRAQMDETYAALEFVRSAIPEFQGLEFAERYQDYEDRIARSRQGLSVRIESDALAREFSQRLVNLLARENVRASLGRAESGYATIRINSYREQYEFSRAKQVKLTLLLTTLDERNRQLASVERMEVGESLSSHDSALKQAANRLARECEARGVVNYLGL